MEGCPNPFNLSPLLAILPAFLRGGDIHKCQKKEGKNGFSLSLLFFNLLIFKRIGDILTPLLFLGKMPAESHPIVGLWVSEMDII
jgi:hypothetical protein